MKEKLETELKHEYALVHPHAGLQRDEYTRVIKGQENNRKGLCHARVVVIIQHARVVVIIFAAFKHGGVLPNS